MEAIITQVSMIPEALQTLDFEVIGYAIYGDRVHNNDAFEHFLLDHAQMQN